MPLSSVRRPSRGAAVIASGTDGAGSGSGIGSDSGVRNVSETAGEETGASDEVRGSAAAQLQSIISEMSSDIKRYNKMPPFGECKQENFTAYHADRQAAKKPQR